MDNIDLPAIVQLQHSTKNPLVPSTGHKRPRSEYDPSTSSDPAMFSSDDHAPCAEAYSSERRKEQWKGTWWGGRVQGVADKAKRKLERNYDSGVWMGSEDTDTSLDDEFLADVEDGGNFTHASFGPTQGTLCKTSSKILQNLYILNCRENGSFRVKNLGHKPSSEPLCLVHARAMIQSCLESGNEDVDLSSMSLESLPPSLLAPLMSLTRHSAIHDIPASQETYTSIEANLRLYLANNSINRLPSVLFDLSNLRVLSVRHNNLVDLPPAIGQLIHLETLNVAGNKLKFLPYEVLDLCRNRCLKHVVTDPNPWHMYEMQEGVIALPNHDEGRSQPILIAQSAPEHFHVDGTRITPSYSGGGDIFQKIELPNKSTVPSLLGLALLACQKLPYLAETISYFSDEIPDNVQRLLTLTRDVKESGGRSCTICRKEMVVPRVQWMEWWYIHDTSPSIHNSSHWIPFLRQRCSLCCKDLLDTRDKSNAPINE